jgi:hypothetical protein
MEYMIKYDKTVSNEILSELISQNQLSKKKKKTLTDS